MSTRLFTLLRGCLLLCLFPVLVNAAPQSDSLNDLSAAADGGTANARPPAPAVPADWSQAASINEASRRFQVWQQEMLKQRQSLPPELKDILRKKSYVPPLGPSQPQVEPPHLTLNIPILPDPTGRVMPSLNVSIGAPTVSFSAVAEGKVANYIGVSYKAGASYATDKSEWAFGGSGDVKVNGGGQPELAGTYQFHACTFGNPEALDKGKPVGAELSARLLQYKGAVGFNDAGELSVSAGYDIFKTPETFKRIAELSVGVESQLSAPITGQLVRPGDRYGMPQIVSGYAAKVALLLTRPVDCPYCSARGELQCPQCHDARQILCTTCNGKLTFTCPRCEGSGDLYCSSCNHTGEVNCSTCSGRGNLRCSSCGGSGQVTVYESEIRSREELVVDAAGFDDAGSPVYERHYETRSYTEQVPHSQSCSTCGGNGDGGTCGTCGGDGKVTCGRCGGGGTVTCGRCDGNGRVKCDACNATGKITCPTCDGQPIECPLCGGKKTFGGK